jgi:hypothetical protein
VAGMTWRASATSRPQRGGSPGPRASAADVRAAGCRLAHAHAYRPSQRPGWGSCPAVTEDAAADPTCPGTTPCLIHLNAGRGGQSPSPPDRKPMPCSAAHGAELFVASRVERAGCVIAVRARRAADAGEPRAAVSALLAHADAWPDADPAVNDLEAADALALARLDYHGAPSAVPPPSVRGRPGPSRDTSGGCRAGDQPGGDDRSGVTGAGQGPGRARDCSSC